ncbi:MAG: single-stranded-DNA-specific exonuclease RecJ [Longimicrobiales bacterium]
MTDGRARVAAVLPPAPRWADPVPPDPGVVAALTAALRLPAPVCAVLAVRGFGEVEAAKRHLRPRMDHGHDPALLADGLPAAERIATAVRSGETILVHGDYDVDGICATALYTRWLRSLGGSVVPFVPHRVRDGYDFGPAGLRAAEEAGAGLILTADCGTVATGPVREARAAGRDVVVTDHHTVGASPAEPTFLVNPQRPDCAYPDTGLCGAGVAYKVCALVGRLLRADPEELGAYLDLVALATVADLVPLRGENRVLVRYGLRRFAHTRVPGVAALLEVSDVDPVGVGAGALGFRVAPRINAAGRIGESADALRLLLTDDPDEARRLAASLDEINRRRQDEDRRTLDEALEVLEATYDPERDTGVVLAGEGWHPGVIGIVASRIVERIHRPTVLLALDGDRARGSARSIPGFHLYDALAACSEHMLRFGGHAQAAGMDVARSGIPAFRAAFDAEARARVGADDLRPVLRADVELGLDEADLDLVRWLDYLGPHGIGNPRPVFLARRVRVEGPREVGTGHLKARLRPARGNAVDAIGFGLVPRIPPDSIGDGLYDALVKLETNEWRGEVRLQARLVDLRPSAP